MNKTIGYELQATVITGQETTTDEMVIDEMVIDRQDNYKESRYQYNVT